MSLIGAVCVLAVAFLQTSQKISNSNITSPPSSTSSQESQVSNHDSRLTTNYSVSTTNAFVSRVVDGDTLIAILDSEPGKEYRVRLLGINTPETVDPRKPVECFGKHASAFTKKLLTGKRVSLAADPQADEMDKYGRLLRNVYLEDGTDVNALLVKEGYAQAYLSFPLDKDRKTQLRQLEQEAKDNERGLWALGICAN